MSLEETSAIFDGPDAVRNVAHAMETVEVRDGTSEEKEKDLSAETVQALRS
jgi:hypothetical protein